VIKGNFIFRTTILNGCNLTAKRLHGQEVALPPYHSQMSCEEKSSAPTNNQIYPVPANQFSPSLGTTLEWDLLPSQRADFNVSRADWSGKTRLFK